MRVAIVATYPPRPCGIGTFTADLRAALLDADPLTKVDVIALAREQHDKDAPEVVASIRQDVHSDYSAIPRTLTSRGTDVVLVEHEYGIFGGIAGSFITSLAEGVTQPLVVTLHTVLSEPSVRQAEALRALCHRATLVTVFTETARSMVIDSQLVPPERVRVIPHGAPTALLPDAVHEGRPAIESLAGRTVLSTFGLISSGKGIEVVIKALPAIVAEHPEVLYLVAGNTHPEVVKHEGEQYRLQLERLVRDLDLNEHVHFLDRFLTVDELAGLLSATDLYLTPYRSKEQIVSGALTFAVVAGCPVVSTPYRYAEDLLASGAGVLVPFDDPAALGAAVLSLLDDQDALRAAGAEARQIGSALTWPAVGSQMLQVLAEAVELGAVEPDAERLPAASSPRLRPDHLLTLVDDVGIVQHADGVVPRRETGYCVDDVARLVIVALALDRDDGGPTYRRMHTLGLSFLRHAWDEDSAGMHNFMSYDRRWLDEPHVGDHLGRTAWALGEVIAAQPPRAVAAPSLLMLSSMATALAGPLSPRGTAFTVLGLARPSPEVLPDNLHQLLRTLTDRLVRLYRESRTEDWQWFEERLTYDNARLPQALLAAGSRLGDDALVEVGLEALAWYGEQCALSSPVVRLIGNGWRERDGLMAVGGDEQPLDAAALVEAYAEALTVTGDHEHGRLAIRAFEWFFGRNRLGVAVYDFATGGCHDGLGSEVLNENEGAESTLSFLQALLALEAAGLQASLPRP